MTEAADRLLFCKQALGEIGTRSTIVSLDPPDTSQEAYYCNLFFEITRDQVLRAAHWNFAGRTEVGVLWKAAFGTPEQPNPPTMVGWDNRTPAPPWSYSYTFPVDPSVQIRRVRQQSASGVDVVLPLYTGIMMDWGEMRYALFEVSSDRFSPAGVRLPEPVRVILTNAQNALIDFTTSDVVIAEFDSMFYDAFMLAFSAKLALALTGDRGLYAAKLQQANNSIIAARTRDGNEGLTIYEHVPDWLQVRGVAGVTPGSGYYPYYGPLFSV